MKKFLSIMLALALVLSLGTVAFAAEYDSYIDVQPKISKTYQVNNGTAPAETFTYTFTGVSYEDTNGEVDESAEIPAIAEATISFDAITAETGEETKEATLAIDVAKYELGVYTYEVTETAGNTAGVTYTTDKLYLVLSVILNDNDEKCFVAAMHKDSADSNEKVGELTNTYDAGSLTVTKQIEGNMADMEKKFEFTVVFTPAEGTVFNTGVQIANDTDTTGRSYDTTANDDGTYTIKFELGDDETATFTNIPARTTYTVEENEDGYTKTNTTKADGSIAGGETDADVWTNTLNNDNIDTGIFLDSMPYVLILAAAGVGLVVFFARRRMTHKG